MAKNEVLTVDEVAEEVRISVSAVRRAMRSGDMPRVNLGPNGPRRYLMTREQLDAWLRRPPEANGS